VAGTRNQRQMRNYPINFVVKHPNHRVVSMMARPGAVKTCRTDIRTAWIRITGLACFQVGVS
jgi:hypothetical protein